MPNDDIQPTQQWINAELAGGGTAQVLLRIFMESAPVRGGAAHRPERGAAFAERARAEVNPASIDKTGGQE